MKPVPILSLADYQILRELSKNSINVSNAKELTQLSGELDRAIIVKEGLPENNVVQINSFLEIEDVKAQKRMKIQIVLPSLANIKEAKVSVLAPLSIALIGFKENDEVEWDLPAGMKTLRIIAVTNSVANN
ncbi:GreA/GreB family elongation factor [Flavobacterium kingsejongi]|uniref:Transcription elongation factor GreA/GreB C-terminal domain-containing protein n=1 Tax=Flavobacterium kingsejongi TaxID=1678728 RepID=A0A2S1LPZ3_9FLAO|nr:GreA/GreB family elongation factor [Flavobacterium kingsejongi]AWG25732.1 hypothetical protein FK004_11140 [Flavobacterium kingsejongi]